MIPILVMIIGLAASALLHFLYRNTYTDYERIDGVKVWTKRVTLKRKDFVLCYGINIIPFINITVLAFLYLNFIFDQNDYDFHLHIDNKFIHWLNEEV